MCGVRDLCKPRLLLACQVRTNIKVSFENYSIHDKGWGTLFTEIQKYSVHWCITVPDHIYSDSCTNEVYNNNIPFNSSDNVHKCYYLYTKHFSHIKWHAL